MRVRPIPSQSSVPPVINEIEARWAAEAVASLARQLDSDSVVALVLKQAHQELTSLLASTALPAPRDVIGPVRVRVAA
jgi:hypothetical protein